MTNVVIIKSESPRTENPLCTPLANSHYLGRPAVRPRVATYLQFLNRLACGALPRPRSEGDESISPAATSTACGMETTWRRLLLAPAVHQLTRR
jgi:hypothetical protein